MLHKTPARVSVLLCLALCLSCADRVEDGPFARASVIERLDETIGGVKALGRPGDIRLENDHFRSVVLGGRNSVGPGLYGGSLVDVDLQWRDPSADGGRGRDQFTELFPTVNLNVPLVDGEDAVWVVSDGSDGGPAIVRTIGMGEPFLSMVHALWALVRMPTMWMVTDYIAEPGVPWVTLRTTVSFGDREGAPVEGEAVDYATGSLDVVKAGLEGDDGTEGVVMGDFMLSGGSVNVFAPGIGFDENGAVYRANVDGRNTFSDPFNYEFVAAVGDGVSYALVPSAGESFVPLFSASQTVVVTGTKAGNGTPERFVPGSAFTYERHFLIGHGDVGSLMDQYVEIREIPWGEVTGSVLEEASLAPISGVNVLAFRACDEHDIPDCPAGGFEPFPYSHWRTDVRPDDDVADGSFGGRLPVGTYQLAMHDLGRPEAPRVTVEITEGEKVSVRLEALRPGTVRFSIRDEVGERVPAKLSIFKLGEATFTGSERIDEQNRRRKPSYGDGFIGGDPYWVLFEHDGEGEFALPAGEYRAVASRGVEYEIDEVTFIVDDNRSADLQLQVVRSVNSDGWVSADLHVHSAPSHDSGVTLPMRVQTMVAEGVEFFVGTDHDQYTDFAPVVEELGMEEWVQTAVGVEVTTLELGHHLGFPLEQEFMADGGGAFDWKGLPPGDIHAALREEGRAVGFEPLVFIAHPRDGIFGYFDQYGLDPFSGAVDEPEFISSLLYSVPRSDGSPVNPLITPNNITMDMDALELFTGKRSDQFRTPTQPEHDAVATSGEQTEAVYDWFSRTMEEQEALSTDVYRLTGEVEGNVDDWFSLLNMGYRYTAIGNSDTHGLSSVESGCPRNFVMSETDDPAFLDDQAMADAVREHKVTVSYGPFLRMWVEGAPIGSDVVAEGAVDVEIEVQAPSWIDLDRVELYENGVLIQEWEVGDGPPEQRFFTTFEANPSGDAWYVAIAMGDESLRPVFTPVEIPYIPLDEAVTGALGSIGVVASLLGEPVPFPKEFEILPYAMTNPVWVDVDGGGFQPPGLPSWLRRPE